MEPHERHFMSTRSERIQATVLVVSGVAVAVIGLWGSRFADRMTVAAPGRLRRKAPTPPRWTGREILGADEALRRWDVGTR